MARGCPSTDTEYFPSDEYTDVLNNLATLTSLSHLCTCVIGATNRMESIRRKYHRWNFLEFPGNRRRPVVTKMNLLHEFLSGLRFCWCKIMQCPILSQR